MNTLLDDNLSSNDIQNYEFRGKLAGKSWTHAQSLYRIEITRRVIFLFAVAIFYPVFMAFVFGETVNMEIIVERLILSLIMIGSGVALPRFRLPALLIALLPVSLILFTNIMYGFSLKQIGFNGATLILICVGIFYHFKEISQRKELVQIIREGGENVVRVL